MRLTGGRGCANPARMLEHGDRLSLQAPAKVNLYLEILGSRPDGYHNLRSVLMPVSLFDDLVIESTDGDLDVCVHDGGLGLAVAQRIDSDDNLVLRAARRLRDVTGCTRGARIALTKRIPVGGGLGGGSADAAATLTGLNRLWGTGLNETDLIELGAGIGCDVPALICGGAVLMEERGERVHRLRTPGPESAGWWLVLVNPGFSVSTADVYSRCTTPLTSANVQIKSMVSSVAEGDRDTAARSLFNGLEAVVFRKYPVLEMIAEGLKQCGALGALLSGSGASVFGLALSEAHALAIQRDIADVLGFEPWTAAVKTLPDGVMVAHGPLEA